MWISDLTRGDALHATATARSVALVRIWVCAIWLAVLVWTPFEDLLALPRGLFEPVGFLGLIPDAIWDLLLTETGLTALRWALVAMLVAIALGIDRWNVVLMSAVVLLVVQQGMMRMYTTHMNRGEIPLLLVTMVLAVTPCYDAWALLRRRRAGRTNPAVYPTAMMAMTLLLLLTYAMVAAARLAYGGLEVFVSDSMKYWTVQRTLSGMDYEYRLGLMLYDYPVLGVLLKMAFFVVTVFELLSPLCLVNRVFRYVWLVVIAGFHVSTMLTMNIIFVENILLMPVLLVDFSRWLPAARGAMIASRGAAAGAQPVVSFDGP